jgi:hypothetical protein
MENPVSGSLAVMSSSVVIKNTDVLVEKISQMSISDFPLILEEDDLCGFD